MDSIALWATVIIAGAISAVAIFYVMRPLLAPGPAAQVIEDDKLSELVGRKDAALKAIKDLEFDYRVGKLSEEDYQRLDQRLRRQAIALIQQVENLAPQSSTLDERLEAQIAAMRKVQPQAAIALSEGDRPLVVPVPAARPGNGAASRYCTNCGHLLEPAHKFCANCGAPAAAPALVSGDGAAV
ncbi:MAG: zinc ribbon domain-containing protein [Caldilineaceae bacterium]|nr:zinc ribbon domain-containing protein [Caldilineaceae bacterium]